jgi:hypothetical protein
MPTPGEPLASLAHLFCRLSPALVIQGFVNSSVE